MNDVSQLLESLQWRVVRWAVSALVVGGLHAGGLMLALMYQPDDAWDDPAGGVSVDLVAPPAPMPVQSEDLEHGPEQPHGSETAEATKQVVQQVEKDLPRVEQSPAPNPEVVLPKLRPDEKEQPKAETREAAATKVAQEEGEEVRTAPPRIEAKQASAAAKSEGLSPSIARAQAGWMNGLMRELERHKRIPEAARKQRGQWKAVVVFTVDRAGKVLTFQIREGSGVPALDEESLALLKRVSFPPAPDQLPGETFEYSLPIKFKVD
ncbi:MAG: energy transducer TonB [Hyphomicrobiaceae bacterium]